MEKTSTKLMEEFEMHIGVRCERVLTFDRTCTQNSFLKCYKTNMNPAHLQTSYSFKLFSESSTPNH